MDPLDKGAGEEGWEPLTELEAELAFHLDRLTEEFVAAGLSHEEARRRAHARFESVERVRRDCSRLDRRWEGRKRRRHLMGALTQDVRYGMRLLARRTGFTATVVLTLAVGIGANLALLSVLDAVVLRPLPYAEPDRLVRLWETNAEQGRDQTPGDPRDRSPVGSGSGRPPLRAACRSSLELPGPRLDSQDSP